MHPLQASRRLLFAALAAGFVSGCASPPPPTGLDLRGAAIVAATGAPALDINGLPGGKVVGAGVGAGTGAGAGVVFGAVGCLAAGPMYPVCLLAVVPAAAGVGAATGAVVGAVRTEGVDAIALKTDLVKAELGSTSYHAVLAEQLQKELRDDFSTELSLASADASPAADARRWQVDVALTEVGTEGKSEFALRVVARLQVHRQGEPTIVYETRKEVQSETELTTTAWTADDARAIRGVMDLCVRQVAHRFVLDLMPSAAGAAGNSPAPVRNKYSTSCQDVPAAWAHTASS